MQVELGDFALFFCKAATQITFEGTDYLVVPHAAILRSPLLRPALC
jgi:hypothetical protein